MPGVYYIPNGPKNLKALFPSFDFSMVQDYYVEVYDEEGNIVATSPLNVLCNCNSEGVRVHFLNYCGTYDSKDFPKVKIVHEDTADSFENALKTPLSKTDTGTERFNVRSNDTYEVKCKCLQTEMQWLQECKDSVKAFIEWSGTEGQADSYLPIVILSGKIDKLKDDREFDYEFTMQFKLANEYINIRN